MIVAFPGLLIFILFVVCTFIHDVPLLKVTILTHFPSFLSQHLHRKQEKVLVKEPKNK